MFRKILIANRGEIAVRIARAARRLGVDSVAVFSEADRNSLHVRSASESVYLGDGPASTNYLDPTAIIEAALASGAQAIHPGYGFLSENASFAAAVTDAGLTFIGPPATAIAAMGEKVAARAIAVEANVPLAPGSTGPVGTSDAVVAFGAEHGYPVLVKASHGGGGRGMREVASADHAADAFDAAVREATAAFGNGEVYVERYLVNARHVEVQVFADAHGTVVWLGDRDCSVQRRHQKLIEEAPAPGLSDGLRRAMGEAAVRLAKTVGYQGAGTVEFLVEGDKYYFLEMNTRIQVEHPVTEEVLGVDLVAEQIRVAAGEPLSITESGPPVNGVAIEARINAEDVSGGLFLPSPGLIEGMRVPVAEGLRFDAGYEGGDEVPSLYDSLVGKLIAWGPDRSTAIERLKSGLTGLQVSGIRTTAPASLQILNHQDFRDVAFNTLWLESTVKFDDAADIDELDRDEVFVGGRYYRIPYFDERIGAGAVGIRAAVATEPDRQGVTRLKAGGPKRRGAVSDGTVRANMQGTIIKVNVSVGDSVAAGDLLFVLEAMKMENPIKAPLSGTITQIEVAIGDSVPAKALLAHVDSGVGAS